MKRLLVIPALMLALVSTAKAEKQKEIKLGVNTVCANGSKTPNDSTDSVYTIILSSHGKNVDATVLAYTIKEGTRHLANLKCVHIKSANPPAPDMMIQTLECGKSGLNINLYSGGFAGRTIADLFVGEIQLVDNMLCHHL